VCCYEPYYPEFLAKRICNAEQWVWFAEINNEGERDVKAFGSIKISWFTHHQPDISPGSMIFTTKLQYFLPTADLVIVSSSKFNLYWQGLF
jgi:hypothetical protein